MFDDAPNDEQNDDREREHQRERQGTSVEELHFCKNIAIFLLNDTLERQKDSNDNSQSIGRVGRYEFTMMNCTRFCTNTVLMNTRETIAYDITSISARRTRNVRELART
jgi:hypothetical protein